MCQGEPPMHGGKKCGSGYLWISYDILPALFCPFYPILSSFRHGLLVSSFTRFSAAPLRLWTKGESIKAFQHFGESVEREARHVELRRYDSVVILYDPTCKHGVNGATKLHILILWTHKSTYFFNHSSPRLSPNQGHTSSSISISRIWNRSSSRWFRSWVTRCRAVTSSCRRRLSPSSRSLLARQPAAT